MSKQTYLTSSVTYTESVELESSPVSSRKREVNKKIKKTEVTKMPSKFQMAKNLTKSVGNIAKAAITGEGVVASMSLVSQRMDICKACPWFVSLRPAVQFLDNTVKRGAHTQCFLFSTWVESFSADSFHFCQKFSAKIKKYWKIKIRKNKFC